MKNLGFVVLLISALLLLFLSTLPIMSAKADHVVIRVPVDYPTIQEAINASSSGSVILVSSGVYHENLVVNKTLTLIGEDRRDTIIDGDGRPGVRVTADGVVVDGFTMQHSDTEALRIDHSDGCTISGNIITLSDLGIRLCGSSFNTISNNIISRRLLSYPPLAACGLCLEGSHNNAIHGNILTYNQVHALSLWSSNQNLIFYNTIENNGLGVWLVYSNSNVIHHNNFINNEWRGYVFEESYSNSWHDGLVGNYWDGYAGLDDGSGDRVPGDGVGDTDLPHLGVDDHPSIRPFTPVPMVWEGTVYPLVLHSNSTVSRLRFVKYRPAPGAHPHWDLSENVTFSVTGAPGTVGHCNITIPKSFLRGEPWKILLNNTDITLQAEIAENQTHTSIYFTYNHGAYNVEIVGTWVVPEFPLKAVLLLFMTLSILAVYFNIRARRYIDVRGEDKKHTNSIPE